MADELTVADVERIAALARLALTDDEKRLYTVQLARVLDYARQLAELNLEGVAPTSSAAGHGSPERPDQPRPSLSREAAMANAPDALSGLFRVPRVLGDG
jgi:aspartyl-tRNA(Asn)/glutamyl-tRNA(Gln) amidotransferase subunit C